MCIVTIIIIIIIKTITTTIIIITIIIIIFGLITRIIIFLYFVKKYSDKIKINKLGTKLKPINIYIWVLNWNK